MPDIHGSVMVLRMIRQALGSYYSRRGTGTSVLVCRSAIVQTRSRTRRHPDIAAGVSHGYRDDFSERRIHRHGSSRAGQSDDPGWYDRSGRRQSVLHAHASKPTRARKRATGTASVPVVACHNVRSEQSLGAQSSRCGVIFPTALS
jgi:hypothetical protein